MAATIAHRYLVECNDEEIAQCALLEDAKAVCDRYARNSELLGRVVLAVYDMQSSNSDAVYYVSGGSLPSADA